MINRRSLLGGVAALFCGVGTVFSQTIGYVRKVYLTVHSDKKDEQYGLQNGLIEIHNQDNGKIRRIRISDGIITSSDNIVYKKQVGGFIPREEGTVPVLLSPGYIVLSNGNVEFDYFTTPLVNKRKF